MITIGYNNLFILMHFCFHPLLCPCTGTGVHLEISPHHSFLKRGIPNIHPAGAYGHTPLLLKENRRGALYGFPAGREREYAKRLVERGVQVVVIRETGRYTGRVKERLPAAKYLAQRPRLWPQFSLTGV